MISFIMMAYNVENYIEEAIVELQKENNIEWELIIVEDFSDDNTFEIAKKIADDDSKITLVKNISKGKVIGTNYGYTLTSGDIIKCIDSDDILKKDFFKLYDEMQKYDAHCHSATIVNNNLQRISSYHVNPLIINKTYEYVISNFISLPKWSWSFKRTIADKVFPIPENLPFEDVWISIAVKYYAKSILNIKNELYLYRQHTSQTFGGILNYNINKVRFRAERLLKYVVIIEDEQKFLIKNISYPFTYIKEYLLLQTSQASIIKIVRSRLTIKDKIKLILILHYPELATNITKFKWYINKK
jgi:glycosyltransferase involved in cell wall biosynthesis